VTDCSSAGNDCDANSYCGRSKLLEIDCDGVNGDFVDDENGLLV
jgi:hypothetical protein